MKKMFTQSKLSPATIVMVPFNVHNKKAKSAIAFRAILISFCVALVSLCISPFAANAQFSTLTSETRANTSIAGEQWIYWWSSRTLAVQPDGGYIVVWIDNNGLDGSGQGIFGQRFNAGGAKVGPEFLVNTTTSGDQFSPSIAVAPNGSFIIAWEGPGTSIDVWAQRFSSTGVKIGTEFLLNTTVSGNQRYPEIQFYPNGSFVAGFVDAAQTVLQRFNAQGRPIGMETRISSGTGNVVMDGLCVRPDNSLLMVWTSGGDVYGQLFTNTLQPIGSQTRLNTYTAGIQQYVNARVDGDGNFVVSWEDNTTDGSGTGAYYRRYDKNFNPLSATELAVTVNTASDQFEPQVGVAPNGRFVITWTDINNRDGGGTIGAQSGGSVWMREFDANGNPVGAETRVNQSTTGYQGYPVIDMNASGRFVINFEGNGTQAGQIDDFGIYSRAYQLSQTGTATITVSPTNTTTAADIVTVTMTLTNPTSIANVKPNPISVSGTNEVFATLISGPSPASATVGTSPVTFTWTYQVTANESTGQLNFGDNARNSTGNIFPYAVSNTIPVKPSLFVNDITGPNLVNDNNNQTTGPRVFTIGTKITNPGLTELTNVNVYLGNGITAGTFPVTTMSLTQTNNTYQGSFSLQPLGGTADCSRALDTLKPSKIVIAGSIDFNGDNIINSSDDGVLGNGYKVVNGLVDVTGNGAANNLDDKPIPPGFFDGYREPAIIDGYVDVNRDGIISAADAGTYGGQTKNIYWQVIYDVKDANNQPTFGDCNNFVDDLRYDWVIWATGNEGAITRSDIVEDYAKVRCQLSAAANKLSPNPGGFISGTSQRIIDGKVDMNSDGNITNGDNGTYFGIRVIGGKLDMNNDIAITTADDGVIRTYPVIDGCIDVDRNSIINTADNGMIILPGQTFSITVNNAEFGSIGAGFDEDRDGLWDYDFWYQPVGSMAWPSGSYRLVDIKANITGTGGNNPLNNITTFYDNEPYLTRLFDDRLGQSGGFTANYTYTFLMLQSANACFSPYQEASSGTNNVKYNADFNPCLLNILTGNWTLPVELLNFNAVKQGENAYITWETSQEQNNHHFDIEFSKNGIDFEKIGQVAGAGNSSTNKKYNYLHRSPR